jgi:hypothetical protein
VYLKSNCKIYTGDGSTIPISEIGEGDDALLCFTDLRRCCRNNQLPVANGGSRGNWFYPNGNRVLSLADSRSHSDHGFYRNRNQSVVRLNWRENATVTVLIGQFCCEVPDATSNLVTICINVSNSTDFSSPGFVSRDEHCKRISTAIEQPITSTRFVTEG